MVIAEGGWAYRAKRRYEGSKRALYAYPPSAAPQHSDHFIHLTSYQYGMSKIESLRLIRYKTYSIINV